MSAFVDRYHDAYHGGSVVDLINCVHCQDDFIAWESASMVSGEGDLLIIPVDRLEDTEERADRMERMIAAGYSGPANDNEV